MGRIKDQLIAQDELGNSNDDYSYEYDLFLAITESDHYYNKTRAELLNLNSLREIRIDNLKLQSILHRQIFIGTITVMENFLSDAFINLTSKSDVFFRKFIETHPEFKRQKFELREIYSTNDRLKDVANKVMLDTIYHNLPVVEKMFSDTFNITFPNIDRIYKYVLKRHDLVHRNGKSKDGTLIIVNDAAIELLIEDITVFVDDIAAKLKLNLFAN